MAVKPKKVPLDQVERDFQRILSDPKMHQKARHFAKVGGHIDLGKRFTR